ncbi:hypothetical protein GCM10027296_39100 [Chitinimonas naiadis]
MSSAPVIDWSVWDGKSVVPWIWGGVSAQVAFQRPPVAVCPLVTRGQMAIIGDFEEFGAENLLVYSSGGTLWRRYQAPSLGEGARFGSVREVGAALEVTIGYQEDKGRWIEVAGTLNLDDGSVSGLHRGY